MSKGKFFVIDGTNGSGKATQTKLLINHLKKEGYPVKTVAFPRYGEKTAGPIEAYLKGQFGTPKDVGAKRGSVFFAIDRYGASREIRTWLDQGYIIIADRYVASNMGHQGSTITDADERIKFYKWNDELEYKLFDIPRPDRNIILHVTPEVTMHLLKLRGERLDIHENIEHQRAASRAYNEIASLFPGFSLIECVEDDKILPIEIIHKKVWEVILPLLTK